MQLGFALDGARVTAAIDPGESLLSLLRRVGAISVKNGCDNGDCGTCAVLVDGVAVNACLMFAAKVEGAQITTVAGLATNGELHPLQRAALDAGSVQCGFCTPGLLLTALDLIGRNPSPSAHDVRVALAGNLCRCTGYVKQIEGVLAAAGVMRESADG